MKKISGIALAIVIALALAPVAANADEAKAGAPKAPAMKQPAMKAAATKKPVGMTPDQMKWTPDPVVPGVMMATAWGDMNKGPHGAFHKFPAGFTAPLHTHTADLRIVVISGTMSMTGEDGKEMTFPPGSYYYQPTGYKHITKCGAGSECVAFVVANGKFDLKPVEAKK